MTKTTLTKARTIYKEGGVEKTSSGIYRVTSTSGEEYLVFTRTDRCTCPAKTPCSHKTAVELARSARRKAVA